MRRHFAAFALTTALSFAAVAAAQDATPATPAAAQAPATEASAPTSWNQWRGPRRDASAEVFGTLESWPAKPFKVWEVEVGLGHASPVLDGDGVYLFFRDGDDEVAAAYDLDDGDPRWSQRTQVDFKARMGGGHHGPGPKATPALADGRLFTFGITSVLTSWDAESGERLWQVDFAGWNEDPLPRWGTSTSPLVDGGRVFVHFGRDSGSFVALDAATGELVWRHDGDAASYASPVLAELSGRPQIVALTAERLLGLGLDGQELWSYGYPMTYMQQNMSTPVVTPAGLVVLASEKRPLTALRPALADGRWQVEVAWSHEGVKMDMSTAVAVDDRICGLSRLKKGQAFCVDAEGETVWLGAPRLAEFASVVATPGALLFLLSDGTLVVLDRGGSAYRELARYHLADSETWAHPALVEAGLVVKSYDRLARFSFAR